MEEGLYSSPRFLTAGDRGLVVEYGEGISTTVNNKVRAVAMLLEQGMPEGVMEIIPTYRSLLLIYDPLVLEPEDMKTILSELEENIDAVDIPPSEIVEIPVCYGGELGPDIEYVADAHGLTVDEVIALHSGTDYHIYMIGFTPGFCFLGGLTEKLHTPRLETPRMLVPAGSVGIANAQTGMYSINSPGGWRLIGRTPVRLFSPEKENPFLYRSGDKIRYVPITREEYDERLEERGSE